MTAQGTTTAARPSTARDVLDRVTESEATIRAYSSRAETECRLSGEVVEALAEAGCFRLFRPRALGGLELDPVSGFKVVEEISRIDSAAGWCVTQANALETLCPWLPDEVNEEVFSSLDTILAGSFFPPRRAVPVEGGYRLSGRTTFNSNCHHATWIVGLAHIWEDGEERMGDDGHPVTLLTLFSRHEGEILDNWDTLGMRGTGSHDVEVEDLFVPSERAILFGPLEDPGTAYRGPLYRLTIWPGIACDAVPALGMAQAAIDDFLDLAGRKIPSYTATTLKDRALVQLRVAKATARLESARAYLYEVFGAAWQGALDGRALDLDAKAGLQRACSYVPLATAEAIDLIHSLVGTAGIRNDQPFPRYFRDVHVLTQHAYVSESRLTAVGQVALDLEPDWGFLHF